MRNDNISYSKEKNIAVMSSNGTYTIEDYFDDYLDDESEEV